MAQRAKPRGPVLCSPTSVADKPRVAWRPPEMIVAQNGFYTTAPLIRDQSIRACLTRLDVWERSGLDLAGAFSRGAAGDGMEVGGVDAFDEHGGGLVVSVLRNKCPFEGGLEDGLAEAYCAGQTHGYRCRRAVGFGGCRLYGRYNLLLLRMWSHRERK